MVSSDGLIKCETKYTCSIYAMRADLESEMRLFARGDCYIKVRKIIDKVFQLASPLV